MWSLLSHGRWSLDGSDGSSEHATDHDGEEVEEVLDWQMASLCDPLLCWDLIEDDAVDEVVALAFEKVEDSEDYFAEVMACEGQELVEMLRAVECMQREDLFSLDEERPAAEPKATNRASPTTAGLAGATGRPPGRRRAWRSWWAMNYWAPAPAACC